MGSTPRLYDTLVNVLGQHRKWLDIRHLKTLAWMMVGLIHSETIGLDAWIPHVCTRATFAQSTVRRFSRWLHNERIQVHSLYGPLIQQALADWGQRRLYLALDTSMLWGKYCLVRISVIYRGRAIPLVWQVLQRKSASVPHATYRHLLDQAAALLPLHSQVVFLADRGFADTQLMADLKRLGWHWRIRIKSVFYVHRPGQRSCMLSAISLAQGQACFWHHVSITEQHFGPVHLALARLPGRKLYWFVVSDEPTDVHTLDEYGLRFDIEENFLDDKSNGFQLESSCIRSTSALSRLCFVVALTTLYLVCQGVEVVNQGKRRWVDAHWFRGKSYLKIGWDWIIMALNKGLELITRLFLPSEPDPEPAIASKRQFMSQPRLCFSVEFENYA